MLLRSKQARAPRYRAAALPSVNGSPPGRKNGKVAPGGPASAARLDDELVAAISLARATAREPGFQLSEGSSAIFTRLCWFDNFAAIS